MSDFLEADVVLIPSEAGGRGDAIAPRAGDYRPFVKSAAGAMLRLRFIEGPPRIAPGQAGRVVAELETPVADDASFAPGAELDVVEHERVVGILTVSRFF
ncbi:MAG TPA: hypothetical protein VG323_19650 [Thermoanaerobaculia bacterium]|nr:hypothetical protein [Thermoanaerobaculia bacterium]